MCPHHRYKKRPIFLGVDYKEKPQQTAPVRLRATIVVLIDYQRPMRQIPSTDEVRAIQKAEETWITRGINDGRGLRIESILWGNLEIHGGLET